MSVNEELSISAIEHMKQIAETMNQISEYLGEIALQLQSMQISLDGLEDNISDCTAKGTMGKFLRIVGYVEGN